MDEDIRWIQRYNNFSKAFSLLKEIIESNEDITTLEAIVKEGIVQRFEYTFELAWKTLKDKMIEDGLLIDKISPKYVFKLAFQSKYIEDVDLWIAMTNDRNLMSHTYDFSTFDNVLVKLQKDYYPLIKELNNYFVEAQQ
ncbi:MAG: nucleotidyltransferase substrate binding protein [Bacteroidetes bacterium]|nr:nucleotidyltransferase substrate binding protein [Bacteroidota bacterium]MBU1114456.1 nucleotidyltransferase substrate binding protein [Bacteroidota bacterium]MBU1798879.1 nucleotidyltransferase substrate binding protein [Bacteroidota bacterium]